MTLPARQGITLDEFLRLPEEEPALEYADGVVTQKVAPQRRHGALQSRLAELINGFARPRRLALAFCETRTVFGGRSYVPDVVVYRWDRIPRDANGEIEDGYFETPPDVAVEILSPDQSMTRVIDRCSWYVRNGTGVALLVTASDRAVLVFRSGAPPQVVQGDEPIDLTDVLPGFELTAGQLFAALHLG